MATSFEPGFFDRLLHEPGTRPSNSLTLSQYKASVARDLEALLNTRNALAQADWTEYPQAGLSILNYGLSDFSHLCLSSSADRVAICNAVQAAIERHEPRLREVSASLKVSQGRSWCVEFHISAILDCDLSGEPVRFDAQLDASTQQYRIEDRRIGAGESA